VVQGISTAQRDFSTQHGLIALARQNHRLCAITNNKDQLRVF
jgi:hypothetical protein